MYRKSLSGSVAVGKVIADFPQSNVSPELLQVTSALRDIEIPKQVKTALDFAKSYRKGEGVMDGLYFASRDYALRQATAAISKTLVERPLLYLAVGTGAAPFSASLAVWGASYLASTAVEDLLSGIWKAIEDFFRDLFCGLDDELNKVLADAKARRIATARRLERPGLVCQQKRTPL